jgi:hypothetical protein
MLDRRLFLSSFSSLGLTSTLLPGVLWAKVDAEKAEVITKEMLREACRVAGVSFSEPQVDAMLDGVNKNLAKYIEIRKTPLDNSVAPPVYFNPIVAGTKIDREKDQASPVRRIWKPQPSGQSRNSQNFFVPGKQHRSNSRRCISRASSVTTPNFSAR